MAHRLHRHLGPATSLAAGQYTTETASGKPAVCCPSCGGIDEIDADRRGRPLAAYQCATPTCGFRDWIELSDFGEAVLA